MKAKQRKCRPSIVGVSAVAIFALMAFTIASCGGTGTSKKPKGNSVKLPPGMTEGEVTGSSPSEGSSPASSTPQSSQATSDTESGSAPAAQATKTPSTGAIVYGAQFTVANAKRPDTNKSVITSSGREVEGDYLEVEFKIQNVAPDHLVDLSEYSFRLESPGIDADTYYDYYGDTGTYGKYVDENEISATLLDYSSLSAVTYKVKVGEPVTKVFCFFDLNPLNVARNPNITKDNTTLIIYKASGTEYGTLEKIPLSGYPDS